LDISQLYRLPEPAPAGGEDLVGERWIGAGHRAGEHQGADHPAELLQRPRAPLRRTSLAPLAV
jgi:hypothetical protein